MPMRMPWMNSLEAIFDLLVDDYYVGHPNRKALLSNDYDSVGIACNCHARFGQICVFEFTSPPHYSGLSLHKSGEYVACEDKCFEEASEFSGDDNEAVFLACCNNVCTPAPCSDLYEELIAKREAEELFVFY